MLFILFFFLEVDMKNRFNIIKMHSLIHDQLSSAKFQPMWKYSWFKCGYLPEHYGKFQNVDELCLREVNECDELHCDDFGFIRCSHCDQSLCFEHFFISFHNNLK